MAEGSVLQMPCSWGARTPRPPTPDAAHQGAGWHSHSPWPRERPESLGVPSLPVCFLLSCHRPRSLRKSPSRGRVGREAVSVGLKREAGGRGEGACGAQSRQDFREAWRKPRGRHAEPSPLFGGKQRHGVKGLR